MNPYKTILLLWALVAIPALAFNQKTTLRFDFFGDSIVLNTDESLAVTYNGAISADAVQEFYAAANNGQQQALIGQLGEYKTQLKLDDWLYFQLIRKTAQQISPKQKNYERYTLYKWFLLAKSGYDVTIKTSRQCMLLYVQTDEMIFEIPYYERDGKQYVCLNYHDYAGRINLSAELFTEVPVNIPEATEAFSYRIKKLPDFKPEDYVEKDISFSYLENHYSFKIKLNPVVKDLFKNYPVVDYESCFNIPLSNETYHSLISRIKKNVKGMKTRNGVDYLMRFTRYAFLFERDSEQFGGEKRMTPEQTLLYEQSDCEDRSALFYFLVKEIYNLPMIVLVYPDHVTIAVKFNKPVGKPIIYNGSKYSVCEPTPQGDDLAIGDLLPKLKKQSYEVAFEYVPDKEP